MAITSDTLNETFLKYRSKYGGLKEDYFSPLFLASKFGKQVDEVMEYCAFGGNDYGIDAYYIDKESKNLYVYQFKWSESYDLFKQSYERLIKQGIEQVFGDPRTDSLINKLIPKLKSELEEFKDVINKVYICFVFNGDAEKADSSRVLEALRETLESKKYFIDQCFNNRDLTLAIQYISNDTKHYNQTYSTKKTYRYDISFNSDAAVKASGNEVLLIGIINLYDLYLMHLDMKHRLFDKNIRAGLSEVLPPNVAIKKTLKEIVETQKISPEYFTFHHNGVTLFVESLEHENGRVKIVEPRVLNGAQTINTLTRFIEGIMNHPKFSDYEAILKQIKVIGKIVSNCSPDFVTQVTISNNRQNPVDSCNLRANDMIQLEFEDKFRKDGIYYERQENSFANLRDSDLDEIGIEHHKEIKIKKLAQTLLAIQGEIDKVSEIGKVFEVDSYYKKAFQSEFLKSDSRKIIVAYKIQGRLNAIIKEIESRGESKYFFVRHARSLIWALAIQALFNDKQISSLLENYGRGLTVEADFTFLLKDIGSKKIRIILSELIKQKKYKTNFDSNKFSFLKSKGAFIDCMAIAEEKYGWESVYLTK